MMVTIFFLTLVDDHTKSTWTFLMTHKNNALSILKTFATMVNTQFHTKIKCIRSNNALEISDAPAKNFFTQEGIIHQTTCVNTSQQNGVVEHKHKQLLEVARALLFQANLPYSFWGDCILTATYLINRSPLPSLQNNSPNILLFHKNPDYSHLNPLATYALQTL